VWYYSDNVTALFISVEECKSMWARLRSYYRKALRRTESTSGQAARKVKKWCFEEQMLFLQNLFQEGGWVVINRYQPHTLHLHFPSPFPISLIPKFQCTSTRLRTSQYRATAN
jgi:hypothetical protein